MAGGASGSYLGDFLTHSLNGTNFATSEIGTKLDFISFHAKGAPIYINSADSPSGGFIRMNISTQLQQIDEAFQTIASYPQFKSTPIVMGEYDPDGCAACTSAAYGYRNGILYPVYTAAAFMRATNLAMIRGVNLTGALTWAFEYEQTALLPNETAYFDGFRVLSTQGIDKPVLNVHRMMGMIDGEMVLTNSSGQIPMDVVLQSGILGDAADVGAMASFNSTSNTLYVFVWHYHDNDLDFPDANTTLAIRGLPAAFSVNPGENSLVHYRVDNDHSNSYTRWQALGAPQNLSDQQYQDLVQSGKLETLSAQNEPDMASDGTWTLNFIMPIKATSLLVFKPGQGDAQSALTVSGTEHPDVIDWMMVIVCISTFGLMIL